MSEIAAKKSWSQGLRAAALISIPALLCLLVLTAGAGLAQPSPEPPAAPSTSAPATTGAPSGAATGTTAVESLVSLTASVSAEEIKLGEPLKLIVVVSYPEGVTARFPNKPAVGKGYRFRTIDKRPAKDPNTGLINETFEVELIPVRMGRQKIPPIEVAWVQGEAGGTLKTPVFYVRVRSQLAKELNPTLRAAGEPLPFYEPNTPLIWSLSALGVALLAAALTLLAIKLLLPRLRGEPPPPPPRPAHEIAYERLDQLRLSNFAESSEWKLFYLELSGIVREYFGNRYAIPALGDTTTELMQAMRAIQPQGLELPELESFLDESDLVKFAKFTPSKNDTENALVQAQLFVDRTREEARERKELAQNEEPALVVAPLGKRALGFSFDLLVGAALGALVNVAGVRMDLQGAHWLALGVLAAWMLCRDLPSRGSAGKVIAGLYLAGPHRNSPAPTADARALRNLPWLLVLAGVVAEAVWILFDPDRRRIGDRIALTAVYDARPERPERTAWLATGACIGLLALVAYAIIATLSGSAGGQ